MSAIVSFVPLPDPNTQNILSLNKAQSDEFLEASQELHLKGISKEALEKNQSYIAVQFFESKEVKFYTPEEYKAIETAVQNIFQKNIVATQFKSIAQDQGAAKQMGAHPTIQLPPTPEDVVLHISPAQDVSPLDQDAEMTPEISELERKLNADFTETLKERKIDLTLMQQELLKGHQMPREDVNIYTNDLNTIYKVANEHKDFIDERDTRIINEIDTLTKQLIRANELNFNSKVEISRQRGDS